MSVLLRLWFLCMLQICTQHTANFTREEIYLLLIFLKQKYPQAINNLSISQAFIITKHTHTYIHPTIYTHNLSFSQVNIYIFTYTHYFRCWTRFFLPLRGSSLIQIRIHLTFTSRTPTMLNSVHQDFFNVLRISACLWKKPITKYLPRPQKDTFHNTTTDAWASFNFKRDHILVADCLLFLIFRVNK